MILNKEVMSDILNNSVLQNRFRYGTENNVTVYLSYVGLNSNGMKDAAICVADDYRKGLLIKEGFDMVVFFRDTDFDFNILKRFLTHHWIEVDNIYVLDWQDREEISKIAEKLNLKLT